MSARKAKTVSQNGIWATAALATAALGVSAVHAQFAARRAEREHPATGSFVTVDGVRLHYLDPGRTGPTVVLLHGNGTMITEMEISGLVDRLAESHRVVVFDRPGFGGGTGGHGTCESFSPIVAGRTIRACQPAATAAPPAPGC